MLRFALLLSVTLTTATVRAQDARPAKDGFTPLFNGKDLAGWKGDTELWSVEDGAITGKTRGPDHLKYNKFLIWNGKAADFELRAKFRLEGKNNSGIQYRSKLAPDRGENVLVGYQADMHSKADFTTMLYDEQGRGIIANRGRKVTVKADGKKQIEKLDGKVETVDLTKWHELTIIARGNRLIHKLDGVTTVEVIDEQESERELDGLIGFQVHRGPAMKVQFKDIRLKRFPKKNNKGGGKTSASVSDKSRRPEQIQPSWIWLDKDDEPEKQVFFRREFVVKGDVAAARLTAACDDQMTVFIDGQRILDSNNWKECSFADVTSLVNKAGKHVIAIHGKNGASSAGLVLRLDLDSGWRAAWSIVTDESWLASAQPKKGWSEIKFNAKGWKASETIAKLGAGPWAKDVNPAAFAKVAKLREPTATPADSLKLAKGFKAELLYTVPKGTMGSWVNMCVDPKGRLIVSDQYGSLYRVSVPAAGTKGEMAVEKINVDIGEAQGLLWAFDSLYVVVNKGKNYDGGLYRVRDTDGDDKLDSLETLRLLNGTGEHGPHAILVAPDRKSLVLICGNRTELTEINSSRVPQVWDEDNLLPRLKGRFMKGVRAPGGYISRIDPDGKNWELVATGFRNEFDAALNADNELFTYDADMEYDVNSPWYRPTRVCHVVSGAEFGWRSGGGKWPVHYPDSVPAVVNVGPGSPTGIVFGYDARFPAKYQKALFICDWSYGKMYAVHMTPNGATYTGQLEEFVTGTPLPLTDLVINPHDGAMYFLIGGRRVQSGLYRVTYVGNESVARVDHQEPKQADARSTRKSLEDLHIGDHANAVAKAWPSLGSKDRATRFAARIALEHRPVAEWQDKALAESDPQTKLTALLGLVRQFKRTDMGDGDDIDTLPPIWSEKRKQEESLKQLRSSIFESLATLKWNELSVTQRIEVSRILSLTFLRIGPPTENQRMTLIPLVEAAYPADSVELNTELAQLLVYLQSPNAAKLVMKSLLAAPTQEEQIHYAKSLRFLTTGWTPELQNDYFEWCVRATGYRGGKTFSLFVENIRSEAVARLSDSDKARLKPILEKKLDSQINVIRAEPRPFVKKWIMDELIPLVQKLEKRDFDHGRKMFAAANCFACHRFDNQGGAIGPDLTALSGRFSSRDILESVIDPSKVISDQFQAVQIVTMKGKVVTGRIVNLAGDALRISTNMLDPDAITSVDRKQIDEMVPSKVSMMPTGLLDTLNEQEILDLMAYLLSRGDRANGMFKQN